MKITYRHIIAFILLVAVSIGFGFAFDGVATAIEKHNHPLDERYANDIRAYAAEFAIPEHILWAVVRTESDFVSNRVSANGEIGLMQLTPERLSHICTDILKENAPDTGLLYDPSTNLRCGAAYLSDLYRQYGVWDTVYAAYSVGVEQVNEWLQNSAYVNEQGRLHSIPNQQVNDYIKAVNRAAELYHRLYFAA